MIIGIMGNQTTEGTLMDLAPVYEHAVWADDPDWSNPGDGNAVTTWRNMSGGGDPTESTASAKPTFRASTSAFNNRATVEFDGGDVLNVDVTDLPQDFTIFVVASCAVDSLQMVVGSGSGTAHGVGMTTATRWRVAHGANITGSGADADPHLWLDHANGASSTLEIDGATTLSGDVSTQAFKRFVLGAGSNTGATTVTNYMTGHIAMAVIFDGDVRADGDWATFESAVADYYGITIP